MKRSALPLLLALMLLAFAGAAAAAEQPGLEIFDSGIGADGQSVPAPYAPDPYGTPYSSEPLPPVVVPNIGGIGDPFDQPPPDPVVVPLQPSVDEPPAPDPFLDPFVDGQTQETYTEDVPVEPEPPVEVYSFYPADPVQATLDDINVMNRTYPGIGAARNAGDIQGIGAIVWEVLKGRRVIAVAMVTGPGTTAGRSDPYQMQRVIDTVNYPTPDPSGQDSPMRAAARIHTLLDAFEQPIVEDPTFGSYMGPMIVRLHSDAVAVRGAMHQTTDEAMYLELSRAYLRAATTCDFFTFPRTALATDVISVADKAEGMFLPDGASMAGDVGGVTGNLFQSLIMLDFYTRDDARYRRDLRRAWQALERPARYALDLTCPDFTLPRFGPRGMTELTPQENLRLNEMFPKRPPMTRRIGLAASRSFPSRSNEHSYGGVFAMRSDYDLAARYLAVRFGPLGCVPGMPAHRDFGSIELMSRSVKYIVDGGGFDGNAALPEAHSGLSLDGEYVTDQSYNVAGQPVNTIWRTNASIDFASDQAAFADGKTWQRTIAYIKDLPGEDKTDYWVVLDHVNMQNDNQPRQARIRYQLAPGIQAYNDGAGIVASAGFVDASALRFFAIDANSELSVAEGELGMAPSFIYDVTGGQHAAPAVVVSRTLTGDATTTTLIYPSESATHRPVRIERDADIIRGRTGAVVVDHGHGRIDVVAWAPPGVELITPTLNLQMSADLGVFRLREGRIVRIDFVNLERFQAKEPEGGLWSMRVSGSPQTMTLEPESGGGWQILTDPANRGGATLYDVNFGPGLTRNRIGVRPGELRVIPRR